MTRDWQPTACILCSENCGLEATVEGRHITAIRGDKQHPESRGYLCNKATRLEHYQNHADRLDTPLRRNEQGELVPASWDEAIADIAGRLAAIRDAHSGHAIAYYGGGGQGNHLGGVYASALREALGTPFLYSALAQEKTGDFWVNGRLFGKQTCHVVADVEHADFVLFLGTNPYQSHGFPRARATLKDIHRDPARTMVVVDPRRTETADLADVHLQVKPGGDALLMAALIAVLVQEDLVDHAFLEARAGGWDEVRGAFAELDVDGWSGRAGVDPEAVRDVARRMAKAESACVRADLGLQQSLHSTLNSYLEKLLFLLTGNLGKEGGNNFHSFLLPLIGHSNEPGERGVQLTPITGMQPISKLYPPNILPAEIDSEDPRRLRALIVDSANPMRSGADTQAYGAAFDKLELLVVIDVALTETATAAHWVLPAASQFEKPEATFFNLGFPSNGYHLRQPLFEPLPGTLPEPEIYRRLCVALGAMPERFGVLEQVAKLHLKRPGLGLLPLALKALILRKRSLMGQLPLVLYATLGKALGPERAAAAVLWAACVRYAEKHADAVRRAGLQGNGAALGEALFSRLVDGKHGIHLSTHEFEDTWSFLRTADKRVRLAIPELLDQLSELEHEAPTTSERFPFVLMAGERREWNANTIYRDPSWRRKDPRGAVRMNPADAAELGLGEGDAVVIETARGRVETAAQLSDAMLRGVLSMPHGYGLEHPGANGTRTAVGPSVNDLTDAAWCDELTKTPLHKTVPARLVIRD